MAAREPPGKGTRGQSRSEGGRHVPGNNHQGVRRTSAGCGARPGTGLGVRAVELGTGNYNGDQHCDPQQLLTDRAALRRFRDTLTASGVTVTALGCHGNPLHPDPAVAGPHDAVFRSTVLLAEKLGIERITLLSGCPGDSAAATAPNWVTCGWPVDFPAILEWQWEHRVIPYWRDCAGFALSHGVTKLCFEMHPGCVVYNPPSLLRLREAIGPVAGANLDPSHLMWQGIDVIGVVRRLGAAGVLFHVHAKDTALNTPSSAGKACSTRLRWSRCASERGPSGPSGSATTRSTGRHSSARCGSPDMTTC